MPSARSVEAQAASNLHRGAMTSLAGRPLVAKVPFVSVCPTCAQIRPQYGYSHNSLLRLLGGGYPVEAYCLTCDDFWAVTAEERAALVAAAVAASEMPT